MGSDPEATWAALCQHYAPRDPLAELGRGQLRINQLRILIQQLPPISPMHRASPEHQGWTQTDYLLAGTIDAINHNTAVHLAINSEDGEYEPPERIETPSSARERAAEQAERDRELNEARAWFDTEIGQALAAL